MTASTRSPLRVVVTAGPTREPLDDVRYLSNASTGRMGWEIAREARRRGARVTLLLGPTELPPLPGVATVPVSTTRDLLVKAKRAARGADVVVFAAAPADWRPSERLRGKRKKDGSGEDLHVRLVENPDVAATLGRAKGRRLHVGFALEVERALEHARSKIVRKRFDAIVVNGPRNVGPGGGPVLWLEPRGPAERLPAADKRATARAIWARIEGLLARRVQSGRPQRVQPSQKRGAEKRGSARTSA